ncbi:MAG: RRXRR domain-containing protein [Alkaliphilus sp.]
MKFYERKNYTQPITLGIDSGYLNIGFSVTTEKEELMGGEVNLLKEVKERISNRAMYRVNRRRKLRYRKPRFYAQLYKKATQQQKALAGF